MNDLNSLLGRVLERIGRGKALETAFMITVKEGLGIKIDYSNIQIQNQTIFLKLQPIEKNEILLRKKSILKDLSRKYPKSNIKDIK